MQRFVKSNKQKGDEDIEAASEKPYREKTIAHILKEKDEEIKEIKRLNEEKDEIIKEEIKRLNEGELKQNQ